MLWRIKVFNTICSHLIIEVTIHTNPYYDKWSITSKQATRKIKGYTPFTQWHPCYYYSTYALPTYSPYSLNTHLHSVLTDDDCYISTVIFTYLCEYRPLLNYCVQYWMEIWFQHFISSIFMQVQCFVILLLFLLLYHCCHSIIIICY